jgi:hypothetical protein
MLGSGNSEQDGDIDGFFSTARVAGRNTPIELPTDSYLKYLFDLDDPKLANVRGMRYEEFAQDRYRAPFLRDLLACWDSLYREPFVGITSDGVPRQGLYALPKQPTTDDALAQAAQQFLSLLTPGEVDAVRYDMDAPQWRAWSNPEFMVYRVGLRLEVLSSEKVAAIMHLVQASLSVEGYGRIAHAMSLNGYLGQLVDLPTVMNDRSYWFAVFGDPDPAGPWGWQLFGHHVAVNFVSVGGRHIIAPVFIGGEPALSDGAYPPLFETREQIALELAGSLTADQRAAAVVYDSVLDPSMPKNRLHPADERHMAGAFRDNRIIAYEGIEASALNTRQRVLLRRIVEDSLLLLIEQQREVALAEYDAHLDETWFSWYGATDGSQPFYFRVHSPVIIAELDHHAGVWLSNRLPARFHVHTTLRHPNGNDYGRVIIDKWRGQ